MSRVIHTFDKGTVDRLQGSLSGNNIYLSWFQNGVVYGRALYESEMFAGGEYVDSASLGRWSGAAQFCSGYGDGLPVMHVTNSEIDLVVWERDGNLVYGPKILDSPMSADCTLSRSMESGSFNADFANDGSFATGDLAELFQNEKKIGLELGYNGEFIRKATGQADSDTVKRTQSNMITISAKNKFYDLMQGSITRNYGKTFTSGEKTTVITGYALTGSINDKETVEIRIDALNGKRWIPGSIEIANLTAGFTRITKVYGQTEFFGFVRIRNDSGAAGTPSFDVLAEDCSGLARKVGTKGSIENESKTLTGTTAVRLTQKSVDGTMVVNIAVKNVDGEPYDYNEDEPELGDYVLAVDASGYTTLARTADSAIAGGETVQIDYDYISATSFSMSFSGKTAEKTLVLLNPSAPESYQVVVTGVSGMTVNQYYANYRPLHIFVNASVNGSLLQFVLDQSYSGTVTFEVWARPMESERAFGTYPAPADIFKDLAKRAMYKDVKFDEYSGTLEEGQFTSLDTETGDDLFFQIEEGFDPDTLRIENTSMKTSGNVEAISHDVNIHILEAGYILDNDQNYNWGVRLSVTRAAYSGLAMDYSFQIWGQYTDRKDFLPPFNLSMPDLPQTNLTRPLRVVDITIEEAARKALQVCFVAGRPFDMFINARGEWVIKLVKSEAINNAAHTFKAKNMGSITQKRQSPLVLDRVEIEGAATESYLIQNDYELIFTQKWATYDGPSKVIVEKDFDKMYDPDSLQIRNFGKWKAWPPWFRERKSTGCKVNVGNRNSKWLGGYGAFGFSFEVWGIPLSSVNYQQLYTAKTNPNAGGKYRLNTAEVKNELITDPITAGQVSDQIIIESCQDALVYTPGTCPANPALEPMDTCVIAFEEFGSDVKALIEELTYQFEINDNKPALTMDTELIPRKPWAAGFVSRNLTFEGEQEIQDIVMRIGDKATDLLNILCG